MPSGDDSPQAAAERAAGDLTPERNRMYRTLRNHGLTPLEALAIAANSSPDAFQSAHPGGAPRPGHRPIVLGDTNG